jgi:hypothetical protein
MSLQAHLGQHQQQIPLFVLPSAYEDGIDGALNAVDAYDSDDSG